MITLGTQPVELTVDLGGDVDFVCSLVPSTPWDAATRVELWLTVTPGAAPTIWPATVTATAATFRVPAVQVAAALATGVRYARLHYIDPSTGSVLLWAKGKINAT